MQDRRRGGRKVAHVREVGCAAQPQVPLAHTREQHWASLLHLDRFLVLFGLHTVSAAAGAAAANAAPSRPASSRRQSAAPLTRFTIRSNLSASMVRTSQHAHVCCGGGGWARGAQSPSSMVRW
jgi:hypothetical protein